MQSKLNSQHDEIGRHSMKIYGPYTRLDGRKIIIIDGRTVSYPKYLLEQHLGRKLTDNETCDHIDGDFTNNSISNLRVLSRELNASLGGLGNKYCLGNKQSKEQKRSGHKNGKAKMTEEQVEAYRQLYKEGKLCMEDVIKETGLTERSIINMLNYRSYK